MARSHLVRRLQSALSETRLTLISAPAGYGKTTLVQAWRNSSVSREFSLAWLSLDAGDSDPVRFWTGLVTALRRPRPAVDVQTLATLGRLRIPNVDGLLPALISDLSRLDRDLVLALDEYELIDSPPIQHDLGMLIEQLPVRVRILITTRTDPPLPLARFRARGWLAEIRAADLRLEEHEVAAFVADVMGVANVSPDEVALLTARTEGWAAGVQLAALSLRDRPDRAAVLAELSRSAPRFIVDYLAEDVLDRQPDDLRTFLEQTSILNRLCGPLCDAVVGGSDGQSMLDQLERANLFVSPLDAERRWYRYHPLFAEMLRLRLRQTHPALLPILHRRAADWFDAVDMPREAIEHALEVDDSIFAAEHIAALEDRLFQDGEHSTLQRWPALSAHDGWVTRLAYIRSSTIISSAGFFRRFS